jgi:Rps23 Pro-64 3,4-dihydroxylase Tpa1-like proline 4-hydroxylase
MGEVGAESPALQAADRSRELLELVLARSDGVFALPDAATAAPSYCGGAPYAHLVIDGFFRPAVFQEIGRATVGEVANFQKVFTDEFQKNKTISTGDAVPSYISALAAKFASSEMLRYLEQVTGLTRLIPDPHYNTDYGYYHIVGAGGVLGSHIDHSRHETLKVPHVLNLVVYLSEGWREEDGGSLCLFDASGKKVVKRIACVANRAVLFACTPTAYHGVDPVAAGARRRRHSLYFAYYSVDAAGTAAVLGFPGLQGSETNLDPSANYGTYFIVPFWRLFRRENRTHLKARLLYLAYMILPPFVSNLAKRIYRAFR